MEQQTKAPTKRELAEMKEYESRSIIKYTSKVAEMWHLPVIALKLSKKKRWVSVNPLKRLTGRIFLKIPVARRQMYCDELEGMMMQILASKYQADPRA